MKYVVARPTDSAAATDPLKAVQVIQNIAAVAPAEAMTSQKLRHASDSLASFMRIWERVDDKRLQAP